MPTSSDYSDLGFQSLDVKLIKPNQAQILVPEATPCLGFRQRLSAFFHRRSIPK